MYTPLAALGLIQTAGAFMVRHHRGDFTWEGVDVLPYKEDGTHFKSITRQVLLKADDDLSAEFRYFEIGSGGHSTLERHEHQHAVIILRGSGKVLVGDQVTGVGPQDLVHIPALTWHQFRATGGEPLGFLCVVSVERDRPQRPTEADLERLRNNPTVADFIRV
jgi:quercetin dioxygenase-like cupin family protein